MILESMTRDDYDDAYFEALLCLREQVEVGQPTVVGGRRVCLVDAQLLDDQQVLERWWGKDVAAEIRLHQRCRAAKAGAGLP